jgi:ribosomal protein L34E
MLKRAYRRGPDGQPASRVATKKKKKRECMMCNKPFLSEGIHNRICRNCKATEYYQSGQDYSIMEQ